MTRLPIVLLHGYSDQGESFARWREILEGEGYETSTIHVGDYVTLSNEITIKDIAEGFDRALRERAGLATGERFDAIVHSTGALVIRQWLTNYAPRKQRVKRLIGLAPAHFGSPLAHKGRSWLGAKFKANWKIGHPDFWEAGDRVLAALELGSSFTWGLADEDLFGETATFGEGSNTPFPFSIVGRDPYGGAKRLLSDPGTDGTVRWAGASLTTRKLVLDLTGAPGDPAQPSFSAPQRTSVNVPYALVRGQNHGSILREPTDEVTRMVLEALQVEDMGAYEAWEASWGVRAYWEGAEDRPDRWQQLVVRVVDERGDPIPDWYIELGAGEGDDFDALGSFDLDVHPFRDDPSYRCYHVNLTELEAEAQGTLVLRLTARSGTDLVAYYGTRSERFVPTPGDAPVAGPREDGTWDACIDLPLRISEPGDGKDVTFFYPYTTTLVEVVLNREPTIGENGVMRFL